jgi:hypothetical protein
VNLVDAVRAADPSGLYAMAVEELRSPSENLLAVDARRLAAVAFWPRGVSRTTVQRIARLLEGSLAPPMLLTGSAVRMTVAVSGTATPLPDLQFGLLDNSNNAGIADFGYLQADGGGRGIRTPGSVAASAVFKTAAFNRSAIPPMMESKPLWASQMPWCLKPSPPSAL